jgi:hypothetical protein
VLDVQLIHGVCVCFALQDCLVSGFLSVLIAAMILRLCVVDVVP